MAFVVGLDSSGNQNDWASTNLYGYDVSLDSPTNNFPTINTVGGIGGNNTYSQGNLRFTNNSTTNYDTGATSSLGTMAIDTSDSTGWYWELLMETLGREDLQYNGIIKASATTGDTYASQDGDIVRSFSWNGAGNILLNQPQDLNTMGSSTNPDTSGAHIGFALKNNKMWVRMNGTWYGDPAANTPSAAESGIPLHINIPDGHWLPFFQAYGGFQSYGACTIVVNFGQNGTFSGNTTAGGNSDANGYGDFKYSVPSGFLALCSKNLPEPAITLPETNFNTVLWTGTGAVDHDITGVGFQPDFVWIKNRSAVYEFAVNDSVRGAGAFLESSNSDAQESYTLGDYFGPFASDGYRLNDVLVGGQINQASNAFVGWNWKAGGGPTTDNIVSAGNIPTAGSVKIDGSNSGSALAGTIAATRLSANTTGAFSIITYEGNDTVGATVAHGLGVAPDLVIIKTINTGQSWTVSSSELGTTGDTTGGLAEYYIVTLDTTAAKADWGEDNIFGFTSTTFSIGSSGNMVMVNASGVNYVAYCFGEVEGYSKVGKYEGNGNADGTFVYTGFRPAYLLAKRVDAVSSWYVFDNKRNPYNVANSGLWPNGTWAEATHTDYGVDLLSNGFKWRNNQSGGMNDSGGDYIYLAFAEFPFKYSNAR